MGSASRNAKAPRPRRRSSSGNPASEQSLACQGCGKPTRLVGAETHPDNGRDALYTYQCDACGLPQAVSRNAKGRRIKASPEDGGQVSDAKQQALARERQQLLLREMRHRTQNLITVIQSIARLSLRSLDPKERQDFFERLVALGRAHTMLAEAAWEGASLSEILQRELAAFSGNLVSDGCDVHLSPEAAQQFALIIHELATNSIKHGSLSVQSGRIAVNGRMEQGGGNKKLFRFVWQEMGGPTVLPPERHGFGSTVLVQGARSLGRNVALDFFPSGLRYELQVPMTAFVRDRDRANRTKAV